MTMLIVRLPNFQVCRDPSKVKKGLQALSSEDFVASQRQQLERVSSGFDEEPDLELDLDMDQAADQQERSDGFPVDAFDPNPAFAAPLSPPPDPLFAAPSSPAEAPPPAPARPKADVIDLDSDDENPPIATRRREGPMDPPSRLSASRPREPRANGNAEAGPSRKKPKVDAASPPSPSKPPPPSSKRESSHSDVVRRLKAIPD